MIHVPRWMIHAQRLHIHVHLHNSTQTVKLISSGVEYSPLFEIVCVHRQSHQEIRSFKLTLLAASTVSQFL